MRMTIRLFSPLTLKMNKLLFATILLLFSCTSKPNKNTAPLDLKGGKLTVDERQQKIQLPIKTDGIIFKLKNIDTLPLKIFKVQTSCACTVTNNIEGKVINANDILDLKVIYNGSTNGPIGQEILIYNSGKENPFILSIIKD